MPELTSSPELLNNPKTHVEVLLTSSSSLKTKTSKTGNSAKGNAALQLWNLALQSSSKREEVLKAGALAPLLSLLERGDGAERYAAAGALSELLGGTPTALAEVANNASSSSKVLAACGHLLSSEHDRSHLPAAKLLASLSSHAALLPRLEPLLPLLVVVLAGGGSGWSGQRQVQAAAGTCLRALLQPTELEEPEVMEARRVAVLRAGGVPSLLRLASSGSTRLALVASACLRFLSLSPGFMPIAASQGHAQLITQLVPLLRSTSDATRAYLCGLLWELATEPALAQQLLAAQAVAGLLRVVQDTSHAAGGGKKKKKGGSKKGGKEEAGGSGPVLQQDLEADPVLAASTALRNATGALHHLSFQDEAKLQLGTPAAVKLLSALLRSADGQLYDNLVGVFWNMAMCADNKPVLAEANVPPFLAQPVPATQVLAIGV